MADDEKSEASKDRAIAEFTDLLGLREPLVELVRAFQRGLGHIFEPWLRRRQGNVSIEFLRKVKAEISSLPEIPLSSEVEFDVDGRVRMRLLNEGRRQQRNRELVAIGAVEEVRANDSQEKTPGSGARVTDEWIDRFWRLAQDVSDADLQSIWSRVLAREATRPGSFSLHTLDVLSRLDREAAKELERLAGCTLSSRKSHGSQAVILLSFEAQALTGRPNFNHSDVEPAERRLQAIVGDCVHDRFAALGLVGLPRWSNTFVTYQAGFFFFAPREGDVASFEMAGACFRLHGLPAPRRPMEVNEVCLGNGPGWTLTGREILSLARVQPDPLYLASLREGFAALGLELEGPIPTR